ncbi:hypothetical protein [Paenibacillus harenae]|uniref:hypothetical protein n=1 Tax=Paenibacillus harenae TaxID=306543 RepID=UPI00040DE09D|nr:hypothetical protein [Paenibacillus harenae]
MGKEGQNERQQNLSDSPRLSQQETYNNVTLNYLSNDGSIIQRAKKGPQVLSPVDMLRLQNSVGNQAVGQLLHSTTGSPVTQRQDKSASYPNNEEYDYARHAPTVAQFVANNDSSKDNTGSKAVIQRVVTKKKWGKKGKKYRWMSSNTGRAYGTKEKAEEEDNKAAGTVVSSITASTSSSDAASVKTDKRGAKRKADTEIDKDDIKSDDSDDVKDEVDSKDEDSDEGKDEVEVKESKREKKTKVETEVNSRPKRRKVVQVKSMDLHFRRPLYTKESAHRDAGGKKTTAKLGPNSLKGMGTDANSSLPKAIVRARQDYPDSHFKAGHLLNADFFGDGKTSANLTILTSSANTSMTAFDNPIKNAVMTLKKLYEGLSSALVDISSINYGIDVSIKVSDEKWGKKYPDNCIAKSVSCRAVLSGNHNLGSYDLSETQIDIFKGMIKQIEAFVKQANDAGDIDNTP